MRITSSRGMRRLPAALAATLVLLLCAPVLRAGDEPTSSAKGTIERRLNEAKNLEKIQGDAEAALAIYEELSRREDLTGASKAAVLVGAARCHEKAQRFDAAVRYWKRIFADPKTSDSLRALAMRKMAEKTARDEASRGGEGSSDDADERARASFRADQRRNALARVAEARTALAARRFEAATQFALLALKLDLENTEAEAVLDEIRAQRPDMGDVLGRLVTFVQTRELEEFEWLRSEARGIERAARVAYDRKDWPEADRLYRKAIGLIDDSGFLTLGATVDTGSLGEVRARLLQFLRATHDGGKASGHSFAPEPAVPDLKARSGSRARALFGNLADMFTPRAEGAEALHFFGFVPEMKRGAGKRLVTSSFTAGLKAENRPGVLSRSRWAERWIRGNIGARWMSPSELVARGSNRPSRSKRRRILIRVGDLICAQCGEQEYGRIEALQRSFGKKPSPLRVNVRLYAVDAAGAVRASEALRTRAGPSASGLDHVVTGQLLSECVRKLKDLQGTTPLGHAQVQLDGASSVLLELTRFTSEHPAYRNVPEPGLTIEDKNKRYGLFLDLYAEDMPGRKGPGNDRSALSVLARVTMPHPLYASHVVPRPSRPHPDWTRRPILLERSIESDREVPHYGTFVLQGIPNPFPGSNQEFGELMVLIGTTLKGTPVPDPPRETTQPAIVPADLDSRDYRLGPLSTEVGDQMVAQDWPALRTVAEGLSEADLRRLRDDNLANILMQLAGIDAAGPGAADSVVVQDHLVHATMSRDSHIRLQQAVQRLRSHENDLYQVLVQSAEISNTLWKKWTAIEGVQPNSEGNFRIQGAARKAIEAEMGAVMKRPGMFNTRRVQPARATQMVTHIHLRSHHITKDLYRRLLDHGKERFTAIPGVAEEGLVVEVRPKVEFEQGGMGARRVRVRARAARLKAIEQRTYPKTKLASAIYDVPVWYTGTKSTHSEAGDDEILDNDTLLMLPLIYPGAPDRRIVIIVGVRKTQ